MKFKSILELGGKTATGFRVPQEVVSSLGPAKRHKVKVTIGPHTYRSTVAVYGGDYFIPLSAENRSAAGVKAGDEIEVSIALDTEPREVAVPDDLAQALDQDPNVRVRFDKLSYTNRREHALSVEGAKTDETRQRRIAKVVEALSG